MISPPPRGRGDRGRDASAALAVAIVAISFAAVFFRLAQPTHPLAAAGWRLAIAALLLSPLTVRALRRNRLKGPDLLLAAWGGLAYAVHFGAWVASLELTSVAASVTLVTASPLLLGLFAVATRTDRPSRRLWVALGLAAAGLVVIGGRDLQLTSEALVGDALALLGAVGMAFYLLLARAVGPRLDALAFTGVATAVGALALGVVALRTGAPFVPADGEAFVWIALAALVPQLVGHTLLTWSLRHTIPTRVATATLGEPVGAALLAWLILGEPVDALVAAGCLLTLAGVALAIRRPRPRRDDVSGGLDV